MLIIPTITNREPVHSPIACAIVLICQAVQELRCRSCRKMQQRSRRLEACRQLCKQSRSFSPSLQRQLPICALPAPPLSRPHSKSGRGSAGAASAKAANRQRWRRSAPSVGSAGGNSVASPPATTVRVSCTAGGSTNSLIGMTTGRPAKCCVNRSPWLQLLPRRRHQLLLPSMPTRALFVG